MKLTTRSEYALLALVYLARHKDTGFISIEIIANAQEIPAKFLEQLMLALNAPTSFTAPKGNMEAMPWPKNRIRSHWRK